MTDREKVIKGLGCLCGNDNKPDHCPCEWQLGEHTCDWNVAEAAIELLKEQEAKPVKIYDESFYFCPKCDHQFYGYYKRPNYCDRCGQEVKWE